MCHFCFNGHLKSIFLENEYLELVILSYGQGTINKMGDLLVNMCVNRDLDILVTVPLLKDCTKKRRLS